MLSFLPGWLVGSLAFVIYWINSFVWLTPIFIFALIKVIPIDGVRKVVSYILDFCASAWVSVNTCIQGLTIKTQWDVQGLDKLNKNDWYLVVANHQSWVDIMVLQRVLNGKIPFIKFFLKRELIYVPFFGLGWWALDFPFMVRYTKKFIRKNPHLKGKDVETTKKACEKFRLKPVSVMNFVEGTRFTNEKHQRQSSPFTHLLKPKAGGTAFVLSAMNKTLHKIIDVTIFYPQGIPTFWDFLSGKINQVVVRVNVLPIDSDLIGDYNNDIDYRKNIQRRVNQWWLDKDEQIKQLSHEIKPT
jgi:1-acyl-sn-glycerol-3-phosphate acyltransferase